MAKRIFGMVMLVMVLVFGMAVAGCDLGNNNDTIDTWSGIIDFNPLTGTWLGTLTVTRTLERFNADNNFETWDASRAEYYGPVIVESFVAYTMVLTAQTQTTGSVTITANHIAVFSGGNIETVWPTIRTVYAGIGIIDDTARSITYIYTSRNNWPIDTIYDTMYDRMGAQINQNGTRIRLPWWGAGELIFSRQ